MMSPRQQGSRSNGAAGAAVALSLWLVLGAVVCHEQEVEVESDLTLGDEDCLYEQKNTCLRAESKGCVWCDLPQRCYTAARSLELREFCTRRKAKVFIDVATCEEIATHQACSHEERCRWCRSDEVIDGCFDDFEALRLPTHIYSCALVSLASSATTVLGLSL